MNKEDYEKLHERLSKIQDDFHFQYSDMKNGKNKSIRDRAEKDMRHTMSLAETWIRKYPNAFDLMTSPNATDFDKAIVWDEFRSSTWFKTDMSELLNKLKDKIKTFE
jgi:hypothetical protein